MAARTDLGGAAKVDERPVVVLRAPEHVGGLDVAVRGAGGVQLLQPRRDVAEDHEDGGEVRHDAERPLVEGLHNGLDVVMNIPERKR